jgi:dethiobiotin synthetase
MIKPPIFVTGIGTGIGKTIVSAVMVEKLKADYWKPIQSGSETDASQIKNLVSKDITIYKERYALTEPLSPHAAATIDKVKIQSTYLVLYLLLYHISNKICLKKILSINDIRIHVQVYNDEK